MLEMEERRLNYVDQLTPPNDCVLEYAVGTTYSLDLGALLGICISTTKYMTGDDPSIANKVKLFAAAAQAQEKITVFCEQGRIANNPHAGELCVLLEGMIEQVVVKKPTDTGKNEVSSFHPKVWVADYRNTSTGKHVYRLLVMSRNLTFDGSWDVVVRLDGQPEKTKVQSSENIARFLRYLAKQASPSRKERIDAFARDIEKVHFQVDTQQFESFEFLPFGPFGSGLIDANKSKLLTDSFINLLVMSPFLGNTGPLPTLAGNMAKGKNVRAVLMSRFDAICGLNPELRSKFECYAPKSWLADIDVESDDAPAKREESDEGIAARYSQLHAKLYLTETYAERMLYLGSMNASYNGTNNNIEALIAFKAKKYKMSFKNFIETLTSEKAPFERIDSTSATCIDEALPEDAKQMEASRLLHLAAKMLSFKQVRIIENDDTYGLHIECSLAGFEDEGTRLSIAPYLAPEKMATLCAGTVEIPGLKQSQVSEFFILEALRADGEKASCVVCCPSELFDDSTLERTVREKALLDRIIQNDNRALEEYVHLAFGSASNRAHGALSYSGTNTSRRETSLAPGLYEDLLKGLAHKDEALERLAVAKHLLEYLPERYSQGEIEAMKRMVAEFEKAVHSYA